MSLVTEKKQQERLDRLNLRIETKYRDDNPADNEKELEDGIILEKKYYKGDQLIKTIKGFDSRVTYSFLRPDLEGKKFICPNCGFKDEKIEKNSGCPYCGTFYNIDYSNKKLSNKEHYDYVMNSENYIKKTFVIDLIISMILSFIYIFLTARTFNIYDIGKVLILGILITLILFYFFYFLDAFVLLLPIKQYKEKQNEKQIEFWSKIKFDKSKFFNNVNFELNQLFFSDNYYDVIDYNIVDYDSFEEYQKENKNRVKVHATIRFMKYEQGKIITKIEEKEFHFEQNPIPHTDLKEEINVIKCPGCNNNIDITKRECTYCGHKINYLQEWYLVEK